MDFINAVISFLMILLLVRLAIRPNEAYFDPIFRLVYRITDPLLIPANYITRDSTKGILVILLALVVLRGLVYAGLGSMPLASGLGKSFHYLFRFLFQAYMVMWFISILSKQVFGTTLLNLIQRAFSPLYRVSARFGVQRRYFYLFAFLFLWILYSLLSTLAGYAAIPRGTSSSYSLIIGFVEGLMLIIGLFPFPGFFSLVIIVGALLSWVNPDPSNPIVQAIYGISEPLISPFRRYIPLLGGIDISPIIALICFQLLGSLAYQLLTGLLRGGI